MEVKPSQLTHPTPARATRQIPGNRRYHDDSSTFLHFIFNNTHKNVSTATRQPAIPRIRPIGEGLHDERAQGVLGATGRQPGIPRGQLDVSFGFCAGVALSRRDVEAGVVYGV